MDVEQTTMSLVDRLRELAHAALLMEMNGWTPEWASLDPEGEWSAGEVFATACTESGETMIYSLRLDPDGEHQWHSVEMIYAPTRSWVKGPKRSVVVDEVAEEILADKRRGQEQADAQVNAEFKRLLTSHVNKT